MDSDLYKPLEPRKKIGITRRIRWSRALFALATVLVLGLSVWAALPEDVLLTQDRVTPSVSVSQPEVIAGQPKAKSRQTARSGADVQETLNDDGSVVTIYKPGQREQSGPALIETDASRSQDPRIAALPNEDLLEETALGRLPVIGADGLRSMDYYARAWSGTRGTRIALVVGGLGLSQTGTQTAIRDLPEEVTLAFAASGNSLMRWMQEARRKGHEILLQVPMEPFDYPANNPGNNTLRAASDTKKNLLMLQKSMARLTNYTGIVNFLGGAFLSDATMLEPVMREIADRGLLFLDDATSAQSLSGTLATTIDAPHAFADMVLDEKVETSAVLKKLDELERVARRNGSAIGMASAFDVSVAAITQWVEEAQGRGIEIVGVSALVNDPQKR
ncbi:divergent polysaccharide deacetylase family protein [Rhizobium sp. CFBP 8762]|uniref:divergent polysaccharide deacetylase family protein n=1 Tax=Rhizobium sp. CFBP 8762 TaxID=2775279 RepID=UPI0017864D6A|nr:divergent polysaccharide deacetylase family protein [Rhizobium sp. CFBP 8762]